MGIQGPFQLPQEVGELCLPIFQIWEMRAREGTELANDGARGGSPLPDVAVFAGCRRARPQH